MQDAALVAQLQKKKEEALTAVIRQYTAYVLTVIHRVAVPPLTEEDAQELAADTFVTLWRTASELRDPSALKAYLAQIARREARRRRKKYVETLPLNDDILLYDEERQPEALTAQKEQAEILAAALSIMEPGRRQCLIEKYYYEETLAAIAEHTQLPLSTVKSHIYRGRQQLLTALKERGYSYESDNDAGSV